MKRNFEEFVLYINLKKSLKIINENIDMYRYLYIYLNFENIEIGNLSNEVILVSSHIWEISQFKIFEKVKFCDEVNFKIIF